jgi:hypothetical protein
VSVRSLFTETKRMINGKSHPSPELYKPVTHYHGSRSGTNFFLREVSSRTVALDRNQWVRIVASNESEAFEITANAVTRANFATENPITNPAISLAQTTRQFFDTLANFGLFSFDQGTLKWSGNRFTASRAEFGPIQGELGLSNNVPAFLNVYNTNNVLLRKCSFSYSSVSRYPSTVLISSRTSEGFKPVTETTIHRLDISKDPLTPFHYSFEYLVPPESDKVHYTNIYKAGELFEALQNGQMVRIVQNKKSQPIFAWTGISIKWLILGLFLLLIPILVLISSKAEANDKH